MISAATLDTRVRVERRAIGDDDGEGNRLEAWAEITSRKAGVRAEFGGEKIAAGRLESGLTGVVTLRRCATVDTIAADCRVVIVTGPYAGHVASVQSVTRHPDRVELLITEGRAT